MKLLLDEHYSEKIAVQLRAAGYDVVTVSGRGLKRTRDEALLEIATSEQRVFVTNNARDLVPIATRWIATGRDHFGVLATSDRSLQRDRDHIGLHVRTLKSFLDANPGDDALRNQIRWLSPSQAA